MKRRARRFVIWRRRRESWRADALVASLIVRKTFGSGAEVGARVTVATLEELAS